MKEKERKLLEKHVIESNAIENIFVGKNHHLFADHLAAAEFILRSARKFKIMVTPETIHHILMGRELPEAGNFRKVRVWVGLESKPRPEDTESLMKLWKKSLQKDIANAYQLTLGQKEELAWHYHHWFEGIHPFVDGNGRTGRLILNDIRLLLDLPWLIVNFSERQRYYDSIVIWERAHQALFK